MTANSEEECEERSKATIDKKINDITDTSRNIQTPVKRLTDINNRKTGTKTAFNQQTITE